MASKQRKLEEYEIASVVKEKSDDEIQSDYF
jgi:hypothetical protein